MIGGIAICIAADGGVDSLVRCLASVVEHIEEDTSLILTGDVALTDIPERAAARVVHVTATLGEALDACSPADAVVLHSDTVVAAGWLDGLRDAADNSLVATATALSNHAVFLSLPLRNRPWRGLPQELTLEAAAARVREHSLRVRPVIPLALGHCVLVRRAALELVPRPATPDDLTRFSEACIEHGLRHVAADDVLVLHAAGPDEPVDVPGTPSDATQTLLAEARDDAVGPLGRALSAARSALTGRRVTIDGRSLGPFRSGTQVHTLELIAALARTGEVRVRVLLPRDVAEYARDALGTLDGVQTLAADDPAEDRDEIVHRPFQVSAPSDVADLARFGERILLTQQDLIGFRTPGYFEDAETWLEHRQLTREALALADEVIFFSRHAAQDALGADLIAAERARVVPIGVDHALSGLHPSPSRPGSAPDGPFLLCFGTSFKHKNRPFALRVFGELLAGGWEGRLVLAGPDVPDGSSAADEAAWALEHPEAARAVVRIGSVGDDEKTWLYANASAVIYPSVYEGFGLVPFEAAAAGTPCLWAPVSALAEVLPTAHAALVPWDPVASAQGAIGVLRDERRANALVDAVRAAGSQLTWDRTAAGLLEAYREAVRLPARESTVLARAQMVTQSAYWGLRHDVGDTGMALVGPDDPLLPLETQRALVALARRPGGRGALLRALDWAARRV